jgi:chromosome segregation ATPase
MPELTPDIIKQVQEECHLAFNDTGKRAHGYEWILEAFIAERDRFRKFYEEACNNLTLLRAERDKLKEEVDAAETYSKALSPTIEKLRERVSELERALRQIISKTPDGSAWYCQIARAALSPPYRTSEEA